MTETIQTKYGAFDVDMTRDQKMGRMLQSGSYPNEYILAVAKLFVSPQSVVADIGSHIGTCAVPLGGMGATVFAFEPVGETCALLRTNAARSGTNITVRNMALGRAAGTAALVRRTASNAGADSLVSGGDIQVSTLDHELERADFIKIDVEGMEGEVLAGGTGLIERSRPVVFFEVNLSQLRAHGTSPRALGHFFRSRDYNLYLPVVTRAGGITFGRVEALGLIAAVIAPRAWLLHSDSPPFDIVAVPEDKCGALTAAGFTSGLWWAIGHNMRDKIRRLRKHLSYVSMPSWNRASAV
ncbi:MAG: FkbM family methyltransferase [Patescibacteria group bacterium]